MQWKGGGSGDINGHFGHNNDERVIQVVECGTIGVRDCAGNAGRQGCLSGVASSLDFLADFISNVLWQKCEVRNISRNNSGRLKCCSGVTVGNVGGQALLNALPEVPDRRNHTRCHR
jgi:hypothetical protein